MAYEEYRGRNKWVANIEYVHASSPGEARFHCFASNKRVLRAIRIVGIAPIIGGHAVDSNADRVVI